MWPDTSLYSRPLGYNSTQNHYLTKGGVCFISACQPCTKLACFILPILDCLRAIVSFIKVIASTAAFLLIAASWQSFVIPGSAGADDDLSVQNNWEEAGEGKVLCML